MESAPDRLLRVNLSERSVESNRVPARWLRRYIGGKGLGARYLYDELEPGVDPLGPENVLSFVHGPLSGRLPAEPRYAAVTRSPLTGAFLDSYSGGEFAAGLAGALGDHLGVLVTGRAAEPVALEIEDGTARLVDATDHWGRDAVETSEAFPDAAVACVGPAGERQVKYATIASDAAEHHAGRGGAGAVMGSKRLKAVVARGERPDELADLRAEYEARFRADDVGRWQAASGTMETVDFANEVGVLSTRGWQEGRFRGADGIGIEAVREAAVEREYDGDVPGGFRVETDEGDHVPRGASAISLGAGLGVDDFDAVAALGETCDRLGVDVISAGNAVAWTVRANEEGVIDYPLEFGDADGARALIRDIAARETPLADALADGVSAAAAKFGGETLVPTVKAMELPGYDPRGSPAMALAYATSDRGGCHRRARPVEREVFARESWTDEDRVRAVVDEQTTRSVLWSLVVDDFVGGVLRDDLGAEWLRAVGIDVDAAELRRTGRRIWTLVRLFNLREGYGRTDDELPPAFTRPLEGGPADGRTVDSDRFERLLDRYYAALEWDAEGVPTRECLERLDLLDAADEGTLSTATAATTEATDRPSAPSDQSDQSDPSDPSPKEGGERGGDQS